MCVAVRQHADKVDQINIASFIESGLLCPLCGLAMTVGGGGLLRWQATLAMTIQGERALASLNF